LLFSGPGLPLLNYTWLDPPQPSQRWLCFAPNWSNDEPLTSPPSTTLSYTSYEFPYFIYQTYSYTVQILASHPSWLIKYTPYHNQDRSVASTLQVLRIVPVFLPHGKDQ
jgi:hypothetical protein